MGNYSREIKYIGVSKNYYRVYEYLQEGKRTLWAAQLLGKTKKFKTEREAAKYVDIILIRAGLEPRNILKPKK